MGLTGMGTGGLPGMGGLGLSSLSSSSSSSSGLHGNRVMPVLLDRTLSPTLTGISMNSLSGRVSGNLLLYNLLLGSLSDILSNIRR